MTDYSKELLFAKNLALEAGEIITSNFFVSESQTKSNFTPVTQTDLAVSKLVISEITKHFPKHTVMDEELQSTATGEGYTWVCDPVDGTIPYSYRIPTSVFSLALCKDGTPVVAVIYDPYMKRLLYTSAGSEVFLNAKPIRVSDKKLEKGTTMFTIPYWLREFDYNQFYAYFRNKNITVSSVESFVYLAMLVASGVIPAYICSSAKPWDRAAAKLMVENAGGTFADETGARLTVFGTHRYAIVSNGVVHQELVNLVEKCIVTS